MGNERALVSMFPKKQVVNDFNLSREAYNTKLQKGQELFQNGKENSDVRVCVCVCLSVVMLVWCVCVDVCMSHARLFR